MITKICPICNKEYKGQPALSRLDNYTPICPLCGTKEALRSIGLSEEEINEIVKKIPQDVNDK